MAKQSKAFKDSALAEITLRKYEPPSQMSKRELSKKLCLSLGLLQPGDSRDVVADVLYVMLANRSSKNYLSSKDIEERVINSRKQHDLPLVGIAGSNIRRQIKRLRDLFLLEKVQNNYRIMENAKLEELFAEKVQKYYVDSISSRVKEYCKALDNHTTQ